MRKVILLLLVTFFVSAVNVYSQEPSPPPAQRQPREKGTQNTTKGYIATTDHHNDSDQMKPQIVNRKTPCPNQATKKSNDSKPTEKSPNGWDNWTDDPMKVFTVCLIVCNIFLWISTKKAADAAKKSAEALPTVEQAYLFIKSIECPKWELGFTLEWFKKSIITVKIENVGRTPAIFRRVISRVDFKQIDYPTKKDVGKEGVIDLPDGCIIKRDDPEPYLIEHPRHTVPLEMTESDFTQSVILCYGCIAYEDIFGRNHETGFCYEFKPTYSNGRFRISQGTELNYHT